MACEDKTKKIDGVEYRTIQFPARDGLRMTARILEIAGPLFDGIGTDKSGESTISLSTFTKKLGTDDAFASLIVDLLKSTYRNGELITPQSFDIEFAGKYTHLYKVVLWVIEANGFFGEGIISKIQERFGRLKAVASQILPIK